MTEITGTRIGKRDARSSSPDLCFTPVIFTGATLIDGSGQPPVENATLLIQDGRIVAAGKADAAPYAKQENAKVIDCTGQTIMPALISDHSHHGVVKDGKISSENYTAENIEAALRQYEGYGVTTCSRWA